MCLVYFRYRARFATSPKCFPFGTSGFPSRRRLFAVPRQITAVLFSNVFELIPRRSSASNLIFHASAKSHEGKGGARRPRRAVLRANAIEPDHSQRPRNDAAEGGQASVSSADRTEPVPPPRPKSSATATWTPETPRQGMYPVAQDHGSTRSALLATAPRANPAGYSPARQFESRTKTSASTPFVRRTARH